MIKIFLIETQKIVREGLRVLLEEEADFQVFVSENKDVKISLINHFKPDLILISLDNLDKADFDYLNIFHNLNNNSYQLKYFNSIKIIVYAGKVNEPILNKALQLGCDGYLLKESSIEELKQAIRSVYNGYKHIGNDVFTQVKQISFTDKSPAKVLETNLVNRQKDYHTGLIIEDSSELDLDNISLSLNQESKRKTLTTNQEIDSSSIYLTNNVDSQQQNWLRYIGSRLLLISFGCVAGIIGVISVQNRTSNSFSPIVKYGIVKGEIVPIQTPYLATIKQLGSYKVVVLVVHYQNRIV